MGNGTPYQAGYSVRKAAAQQNCARFPFRPFDCSVFRRSASLDQKVSTKKFQPESFRFNTSFNCAGLALPLLAFIARPTKNPNSLSLQLRYSATLSALEAMISSTSTSIAPLSETCFNPLASMIASASPPCAHMVRNTSFAPELEMVLSAMRCNMPPSCCALIGHCV